MSLFRESLREFIQKQITTRQKAISRGNADIGSSSRLEDQGAHYTYRQKSCTIRLSSLVDLMEDVNLDLGVTKGGTRYSNKFENYKGSTLARNFILQGGVLSDYTTNTEDGPQTRNVEVRGGFPSKKKINLSYGDPSVAADAVGGDDGYGVVPMPGIVDAHIKTDSFYGSLRRAKVNFVCHNLRQLEILELLYMRPGYPVLMEWGWSPYLNNDGKRVDTFPSISDSDNFWDDTKVSQNKLEQEIIQLKELTNGNYDGFVGFVTNFNYESKEDGGFTCNVEIVSMGEVIDSLKIPQLDFSIIDNTIFNTLEEDEKDKYIYNTSLGSLLKDIGNIVNQVDIEDKLNEQTLGVTTVSTGDTVLDLGDIIINFNGDSWDPDADNPIISDVSQGMRDVKKFRDSLIGIKARLKEIMGDVVSSTAFITKHQVIKNKGESSNDGVQSSEGYIRWDAFCSLLNHYVIPPNEKGEKPFFLEVSRFLTQEYGSITIDPILYRDIEPLYYDISCDPKICILPHQFDNFSDDEQNFTLTERVSGILNVDFNPFLTLKQKWKLEAAIWGAETTIPVTFDLKDLELNKTLSRRRIGNIYIGYDFLLETFKNIFKNNRNASLGKFLNEIIKGLNKACPTHKFGLRIDPERTNLIQMVDLPIGDSDLRELDYDSLFKFKVHSNDTIVRKFQFTSKVPDALKATVAINAQSGATADDLDSVTFAAFNRAIKSRLHSFNSKFSEEEEQSYKNLLGNKKSSIEILEETFPILNEYNDVFFNYIDANEDDELTPLSKVKSALLKAQTARENQIKVDNTLSGNQAVIPIEVTLTLDGISNLIMANVFRVDETRLPKAYRDVRVGFVIIGEEQNITAGSDWFTNIRGHLIMFPDPQSPVRDWKDSPKYEIEEPLIEVLEPFSTATHGAAQSQQAQLDQFPVQAEFVGDYTIYQYPVPPFDVFIEPSLIDNDGNVIYEANTVIPQPIDVIKADIEFYTATPPTIPIEYTYAAGFTFDNNGNANGISIFIDNNAGLPIFEKTYSNVTFTIESATKSIKFTMDNVGEFINSVQYPKTGTEVEIQP